MYTPWGASQYVARYAVGFVSVGTSGHGGIMVTKKFADDHLSEEAKKRGIENSNYYCYEEDCDWAIPVFELPQYWGKVFEGMPISNPREHLLKTLSYWNADYLEERGIEPEPEAYARYLERKREDQMRQEHHHDLIVAAYGEWHTKIPNVIEVCTANDKHYHVTKDSYHKLYETRIRLLSECEVLKEL